MYNRNTLRKSFIVIIAMVIILILNITKHTAAEDSSTSLSGRVVNEHGQPVPDIHIAIKPVQIGENVELKQRIHFLIWPRVVTGSDGSFSFKNIDPVSSQLVIFPEHGSDLEIQSIEIGNLTFYSIAFRQAMQTWFGKLTFAVEPGEHLSRKGKWERTQSVGPTRMAIIEKNKFSTEPKPQVK